MDIKALTDAINSLLQLQLSKAEVESQQQLGQQSDLYNQLSSRLDKYVYDTVDGTRPFEKWLRRHEYTIVEEAKALPSEMRTRLITAKLGELEFERLVDHIAPTEIRSVKQADLITILKALFRDKISLSRRIEILNYRYDRSVPIDVHIDRINRHATEFKRAELSDDNLCILLLLQSFCFSSDNDDLKKIASRVVEKKEDAQLKDIVAELEAYKNVTMSMKTLENPTSQTPTVNILHANGKTIQNKPSSSGSDINKRPNEALWCGDCGGGTHRRARCFFREAECYNCLKKGHIAKVCRSARDDSRQNASKYLAIQSISSIDKCRRIYISAEIRNKTVRFQHDTGCDVTIIDQNEWRALGAPELSSCNTVQHAGGDKFEIVGKFHTRIRACNRENDVDVFVASRDNINL